MTKLMDGKIISVAQFFHGVCQASLVILEVEGRVCGKIQSWERLVHVRIANVGIITVGEVFTNAVAVQLRDADRT